MKVLIAEKTNSIPYPTKTIISTLERRALAKRNQGLGFCIEQNKQTSFTVITRQLTAGFNQIDQRNFLFILQLA